MTANPFVKSSEKLSSLCLLQTSYINHCYSYIFYTTKQHMCKLPSCWLMKDSCLQALFYRHGARTLLWVLEPSSELERLKHLEVRGNPSAASAPHSATQMKLLRPKR